jgi:hypothetical protein
LSRGVTGLADKGYKLTLEERGGFVHVGFDHLLRDQGAAELICRWNTNEAPIFLRLRVQPEWEGRESIATHSHVVDLSNGNFIEDSFISEGYVGCG